MSDNLSKLKNKQQAKSAKERTVTEQKGLQTQKAAGAVALPQEAMDDWGGSVELSAKDIVIPKIWTMQGLSDFVTEGKAKLGEYVNSVTGEVLSDYKKGDLEFIPFHMNKLWYVFEDGEFKESIALTSANEDLPFEEDNGLIKITRSKVYQFFVLLTSELEGGSAIPYVIQFTRTSLQAGKVLATQMYMQNKMAGLPPAGMAFTLSGVLEKNDKGSFIVNKVQKSRQAMPEELELAYSWFKTVRTDKNIKIDQEAELERDDT